MNILKNIFNWITNPENKNKLYFIAVIILFVFMWMQCTRIRSLKDDLSESEKEKDRLENNILAANDTIHSYQTKTGSLHAEISAYQVTLEELDGRYKHLFSDFEKWSKQPPKTIIEYNLKIIEKILKVPVNVDLNADGSGKFSFMDSVNYSDGNSRILSGILPFQQKYFNKSDSSEVKLVDISYFSKPYAGFAEFELQQEMAFITGLSIDKKTKRPVVWVETKYPGVKISKLVGADILSDEESKKAAKSLRREWAIGMSIGYSIGPDLKTGPYLGIGINYSPRWLQFK